MAKKNLENLEDTHHAIEIVNENTELVKKAVKLVEDKATQFLQNKTTEWQDCLSRLEQHTDKTWICTPVIFNGKFSLKIRDLANCSVEDFIEWINYIWPPSQQYEHNLSDYDNEYARNRSFLSIINYVNSFLIKKAKF